ncbi:cupin domain-containing protein [Pseudomonas japonica]|uniref:cupin domain-containing protein n=1 Tax=Pseudomonas japonica TaxID=256466 RepID=UPI003801390F
MTPTVLNLIALATKPDAIQWDAHQQLGRNGASIHVLFECKQSDQRIALIRCEPGARAQSHHHVGHETFLILDGNFTDENGKYTKGDLVIYPPGSTHAWHSSQGALIYAIWGGRVTSPPEPTQVLANFDNGVYSGQHLV